MDSPKTVFPVLAGRGDDELPGRRLTTVQYMLHSFHKACSTFRPCRKIPLAQETCNRKRHPQSCKALRVQKLTGTCKLPLC